METKMKTKNTLALSRGGGVNEDEDEKHPGPPKGRGS